MIKLSKSCNDLLSPLHKAPENVFTIYDSMNNFKGWQNKFTLNISYDIIFSNNIFNLDNNSILNFSKDSKLFIVIDQSVFELLIQKMENYFNFHQLKPTFVVLPGEEINKKWESVEKILKACCSYGLKRREYILAIGGGVVLDIAGMAASLYRRGVPFIRIPTTLLGIVDASVGVKNGVDFENFKNRIGSFYAPELVLIDLEFLKTCNTRNIINGIGEIMKLALVRSVALFCLLEKYGKQLVESKFNIPQAKDVINQSIQIMLEELGPNLWEHTLERCVDFGHTFSKIIEMIPNIDIMHGEAVNIDICLCLKISKQRGYITEEIFNRIYQAMKNIGLPTEIPNEAIKLLPQALTDSLEHRNGKQRIPLITAIGSYIIVNDISENEIHSLKKN